MSSDGDSPRRAGSWLARLKARVVGPFSPSRERAREVVPDGGPGATAVARPGATAGGEDIMAAFERAAIESRRDIYTALGVTEAEFVRRLLSEHGGRFWQAELSEWADFSEATASRLLQDLEEAGEIDRIAVGGQKVVTFPEEYSERGGR